MAGESEANGKLSRRQSNFRVGDDPLMTKEEGSIPIGGRGVDPPWCLQSLIPLTSLTQAGLAGKLIPFPRNSKIRANGCMFAIFCVEQLCPFPTLCGTRLGLFSSEDLF
jgi:hypothetical protein